jgi:ATP-dependent exoDNAse (exonuclease V) alpha subunit
VIDEAGMVGTRQMERVLSHAADAGAKAVLVGDPQQLQSIEAGAAFRSIHERYGGVEIHEVRRQREDWQRDATRDLATGRTGAAIHAYDRHDLVHFSETREQARDDLIDRWDCDRQAAPDASRIILTHTQCRGVGTQRGRPRPDAGSGRIGRGCVHHRRARRPQFCRRGPRHVPAE